MAPLNYFFWNNQNDQRHLPRQLYANLGNSYFIESAFRRVELPPYFLVWDGQLLKWALLVQLPCYFQEHSCWEEGSDRIVISKLDYKLALDGRGSTPSGRWEHVPTHCGPASRSVLLRYKPGRWYLFLVLLLASWSTKIWTIHPTGSIALDLGHLTASISWQTWRKTKQNLLLQDASPSYFVTVVKKERNNFSEVVSTTGLCRSKRKHERGQSLEKMEQTGENLASQRDQKLVRSWCKSPR